MALRLTGTTLTSAPLSAAPPRHAASSLAATARTALGQGDVDALREQFTRAAELDDPHRRFEARLALLEAGFSAVRQATDATSLRIFVALAEQAIAILEEDPAEPVLLNLAGIALYELWALDGACALFKAARRLDPQLPDVERNLAEVAARRRAGRRTRPLHASLPGLTRRATSLARRAQPASGLTLSLCMIVRDEEQMLPRCLAAVAPAVDEIIVVDTGSVDSTIEIARSFGAKVIEFPWTGSFSEARNVSFEAATGDWLVYLDADEVLVEEDVERLRAVTGRTWREAFYLVETSFIGELGEGSATVNNALRVFRNRPEYRFTNQLHEQIYKTLPGYLPMRFEQTTVRVDHYGYLGAVRSAKDKSQRNIALLQEEAAGSTPTPFLRFNLGSEYSIAGDWVAAARELRGAQQMLQEQGALRNTIYAPVLLSRLVTVLRLSGRLAEARDACAEALELLPDFTDIVLEQARVAQAAGDLTEAQRLFERCLEMGDAPAEYAPLVGAGTYWARLGLAVIAANAGDMAGAREHLDWCVEHHADFLAVAVPFVSVLLSGGLGDEEIDRELARLGELPARAQVAVGDLLRQDGRRDGAIRRYRTALEAAPDSAPAQTSLGDLLLGLGAFDEAADLVGDVAEDDPFAGLAVRVELIASIGRADEATVAGALARAERIGLPAYEQRVFAHWADRAAGGSPEPVPSAGVPLLAVVLQTLMSAGDGTRFTTLLPALHSCGLPDRDKRELLAEMFLAHGLLDRAAEQWMAVCSAEPDAPALLGLARVAHRTGLTQDAATFATAALELEPGLRGAQALLAELAAPAAA